ncbi:hypothetical protein [Novosphingobium sp. Gsoil 351]|uniref:hypothetical protein n=1 Tax=Novosphingobium sp. Gsoil 351 TaxID=2675225 RepID=UPI0012B456AF|nr:hypothetical protein [Novosphingobium sp. Gsoil 351]QGN54321.1 hypothetical protein GKE62_06895 [Novosphingobium sp. Gsoil 351]
MVYQRSTRGSQQTRLGDRAQASVGLVRRLIGQKIDYHPGEHDHGLQADAERHDATLDGVLELSGEWEGRERESGRTDRFSGGRALYLSPGLRFNAANWSLTLGVSVPLAQDIRLSHSSTSHRLRLGVVRGF